VGADSLDDEEEESFFELNQLVYEWSIVKGCPENGWLFGFAC
jgi:hypothetical protein